MFQKSNFSFTGHFKLFGIISILLIATGLIGLILMPFGINLLNLDIDFLGGVSMQYDLQTPITAEVQAQVEDIVKEVSGISAVTVTKAGDTQVQIKTLEMDTLTRDAVFQACVEAFHLPADSQPVSDDYVSASVGADLRNSAITASSIACGLILVYIVIRFELWSGIAAVLALLHDLLAVLGAYIIFRIPFNINFIAVALTILGYSINATIVVFDRVRENAKRSPKDPFSAVVDRSILQTMNRSLNTTLTTLFSIILLLIIGVTSIRNFALPLFIGILVGCYSSVCISSPLWNALHNLSKKKGKGGSITGAAEA